MLSSHGAGASSLRQVRGRGLGGGQEGREQDGRDQEQAAFE